MDRYPKLFILFSLIYFGLGGILGIAMGAWGYESLRFAHVHLNLLGFMSMMIYGVGYFILPRFNATTLKWPQWVAPQFWLANIGLIGMIITNYLYYHSADQNAGFLFGIFALMQGFSMIMFVVNLIATISFAPQSALATASASNNQEESQESYHEPEEAVGSGNAEEAAQIPTIDPDMPVGEIVKNWTSTIPVLVEAGFQHLANPEARQMVKRVGVTLRMACERHGLELDVILSKIQEVVRKEQASTARQAQPKKAKRSIASHEIIGDVLKKYPSTREIFKKYYGEGCFTCPGQSMESVAQSAMMHNVALEKLLSELNEAAEENTAEKATV